MTAAHELLQHAASASQSEPSLAEGQVLLQNGDSFIVRIRGEEVSARRAASCLLLPEPGDRVLVSRIEGSFVLAVLEKNSQGASEVVLDGDTTLHARGGKLRLGASDGIELVTHRGIALLAQAVKLTSQSAQLAVEKLDVVGKRAQASFDEAGLLATSYDMVAERVSEKVERFYRFVGQVDRLRTKHLDYRASGSAQIKGEHTAMVARGVAKMDGEQIHMG
jgi:hypothetical protein